MTKKKQSLNSQAAKRKDMTETEYDFYIASDFNNYAGEWIAVLADKVVAHAASFREVAEITDREFAGKKVLIGRVPTAMAQLL